MVMEVAGLGGHYCSSSSLLLKEVAAMGKQNPSRPLCGWVDFETQIKERILGARVYN